MPHAIDAARERGHHPEDPRLAYTVVHPDNVEHMSVVIRSTPEAGNKCLQASDLSAGALVGDGRSIQQWTAQAGGVFGPIMATNELCVDMSGGQRGTASVDVWPCHDNQVQKESPSPAPKRGRNRKYFSAMPLLRG